MDISPDDKYFVAAKLSGRVERWDRTTYALKDVYIFSTFTYAYCVKYSKNGNYIAVSGYSGNVDILNANTMTKIAALPTSLVWALGVDFGNNDQTIIVAGSDYKLQIW